jgi:SAM-dependent methyltransferase
MPEKIELNRLYSDLAWLWPLWQDVEEYRQESERFAQLIKQYSQIETGTILDLGCGGGKNDYYLKRHFKLTGIDISESMLANAGELNPDCEYLPGDMRDLDLGRQFDAVFINDSITYMISPKDLVRAFRTAYQHLKPGGVCITYPDDCKEKFRQNHTSVWQKNRGNLDLVFIENNYDPDPDDDTFETVFIFMIRENGRLRIEKDLHICGLFGLDVWRNSLRQTGFEVHETDLDQEPVGLPTFVCIKPK